jgi:hypothetical protein
MTNTISKTSIMRRAWAGFKNQSKVMVRSFASWLKTAWNEAKEALRISLLSVEQHLKAIADLEYNLWIEENGDSWKRIEVARRDIGKQLKIHQDALAGKNYIFA